MRYDKVMKKLFKLLPTIPLFLFVTFPSSSNYTLRSFEFGAGGESMSSTNYKAEGTLGEIAGSGSSTNFKMGSGLQYVQMAHTPGAPTLVNTATNYNKLRLTINNGNNPSDTLFAVAISSDNWTTTKYVQNDNTVGNSLGLEDYQTYAQWGSGTGEDIIGLDPNLTYRVKVKAKQGLHTEGPYGPEASAATSPLTISFDIDVSPNDQETSAPYAVSLGDVNLGSVTTANDKIWLDFATNADSGGFIYIYSSNSGLKSSTLNHTISSSTTNLATISEGFGIRVNSVTNLTAQSPYDGSSDNVGVVDTTVREILGSNNAPVTSGRGSLLVKVKTSNTTPSANDYSDILTLIASSVF